MNKRLIKNNKGSTLLEVLVGGLIIAICAAMLLTGFITAFNMMDESKYVKDKADIAFSAIEGAEISDAGVSLTLNAVGKITYEINSVPYEITGGFTSANDSAGKVRFVVFFADSRVE